MPSLRKCTARWRHAARLLALVAFQDEGNQSDLENDGLADGVCDRATRRFRHLRPVRFSSTDSLLRPDYAVNIDLPCNLKNAEANRFAEFIKSLPFT